MPAFIKVTTLTLETADIILVKETPSEIDQACWGFDRSNRESKSEDNKKRFITLIPHDHPESDKKRIEWDELIYVRPRSIISMRRESFMVDSDTQDELPWDRGK